MKILVRLAAGGFAVLLSTGWAQAQYGQIPAAPTPPVTQPPAPTPPRAPSAAPQATPAKPAPTARKKAPAKAGTPAKPTALDAECAWTGKRIVSLLARDDVDAAHKFQRFYDQFSCPAEHVSAAFRCVVVNGISPAPGRALSDRVDQCWDKPSIQFLNR
jgi:hypothetical protein